MIENMIAQRYARALISLASDKGGDAIDRFGGQLASFCKLCEENQTLLSTLSDRYQDLFARERVATQIAQQMSFDDVIVNFLKLLIHKGRMQLVAVVSEEYNMLAHEAQGRLVMKVVSAQNLSDELYANLQDVFAKKFNKQMVLKKQILPEVLGGVRVHIGDLVYDSTVSQQIENVTQSMLESF